MKKSEIAKKHADMCAEIRHHDRLYYTVGKPVIEDKQYDKLFHELLVFEQEHGIVDRTSPTQRVAGEPVAGLQSVTHGEYMLSIDNAFTAEELKTRWDRWCRELGKTNLRITLEGKIDGCAISLLYRDGKLVGAVTRGDGVQGDDILQAARNIRGVAHELKSAHASLQGTFIEVRGEAYIDNEAFKLVCAEMAARGETPYKHSRAATVGALRNLDPKEVWRRHVRFVMHGFGTMSAAFVHNDSDSESKAALEWYLPVVSAYTANFTDSAELFREVDRLRSLWGYTAIPMDGIVVKLDKFSDQDVLGKSSRAVNWAIAVKKDLYTARTRVSRLTVQVGKLGTITPVVYMQPVEIDNTTVTKATLHNFDEVARLDIRLGDTIIVEKAGKIIPHVLEVDKSTRIENTTPFRCPTKCPVCKSPVVADGVARKCTNSLGCPAQLKATIIAAAARDRLCMDGIGPKLVDKLLAEKLITDFISLWDLPKKRKRILAAGVGEKTTDKLLAELEAAKKRPPDKLLACLNIPTLGRTKAKLLINKYGTIDKIATTPLAKLQEVLGSVSGDAVKTWFANKANLNLLSKFKALGFDFGTAVIKTAAQANGALTGKKVCATGTFEKYSRETIHDAIVKAGGTVSSSVSSKTAYLVVGKDAGSKLANAEKLGVPRLTEAEFSALVERSV